MQELELERYNHLPMTNVTGVTVMDIGHHNARHHQCEADVEEDVGDEVEEIEEAKPEDRGE